MKYIYFILIFLAVLQPAPAPAEMPDGASDPAFHEAVETWLTDDDAGSLPKLARLAGEGNTAAQILLGRIEQHEIFSSEWVDALSRQQRRALFRAPGGAFGKSWLKVAAPYSELAQAFLAALGTATMQNAIAGLHASDERRALGLVVKRLHTQIEWETLRDLDARGLIPPERRYTVWEAAAYTRGAGTRSLQEEAIRALWAKDIQGLMFLGVSGGLLRFSNGRFVTVRADEADRKFARSFSNGWYPSHSLSSPGPELEAALAELLLTSPKTRQIASACRAICPTQQTECALTSWAMLGGYSNYLELGSPVESLIPPDRYDASRRGEGALLRHLAGFLYPSGLRVRGEDVDARFPVLPACLRRGMRGALSR